MGKTPLASESKRKGNYVRVSVASFLPVILLMYPLGRFESSTVYESLIHDLIGQPYATELIRTKYHQLRHLDYA